ncbi:MULTISPECIES: ABC transporter ATP-binding protein [Pseudolactococcus]|uniref:ABC transporter ATP-binding protein n=2 Tax=Pseudolactococcus TaxID=3436058 RepID=A0A0D6DXE0_9LACT|nr:MULTISPECIES: ABC transporter ATP-binding protein [Lactococcus]SCA92054.1 ABC transporter [Lactococcus piscium]MCJ1968297.1 ABC transporter ATP-binding protein [Lactococcus carnosus]MCJ1972507.1 ABC transporter ATP-binding protein [Lactococcus carnosus]MCJ1981439.1 ABC transporter ATP-binding protein [Lactococcus carnosus]MCJ1988943.1 ABC transporter ATP-binding protein [Lactococcus carnosus]
MISFKNISKSYQIGDQEVNALKNVSFEIEQGEFTVILGPSGSGKSTALNILGGIDKATSGTFLFDDAEINALSDAKLSDYRRDIVGFVFQFYNLIPSLTALENVGIAAQLTGNQALAAPFLESVGLSHRKNNFPAQLSGGEMQRVSIARALAKKPKLLLCDEPTGALDSVTGLKIIDILRKASESSDTAVVMVTHNVEFAQLAHKVIRLHDGEVATIEKNSRPSALSEVNIS